MKGSMNEIMHFWPILINPKCAWELGVVEFSMVNKQLKNVILSKVHHFQMDHPVSTKSLFQSENESEEKFFLLLFSEKRM